VALQYGTNKLNYPRNGSRMNPCVRAAGLMLMGLLLTSHYSVLDWSHELEMARWSSRV